MSAKPPRVRVDHRKILPDHATQALEDSIVGLRTIINLTKSAEEELGYRNMHRVTEILLRIKVESLESLDRLRDIRTGKTANGTGRGE